jgi:hypothetical protein
MKPMRMTFAAAALLTLASAVFAGRQAPDPVIGTWKLNVAQSSGVVPKSEMRTYAAVADGVKLTYTRQTADGQESTVQTTYKPDGKDYPVTGSSTYDTLSAKRIDSHTTQATQKRDGKIVGTTTRTVSKDGKTLTLVNKTSPRSDTLCYGARGAARC